MPELTKDEITEAMKTVNSLNEYRERSQKEMESVGAKMSETVDALKRINEDLNKHEERVAAMEKALAERNRPGSEEKSEEAQEKESKAALFKYIQRGEAALTPEHKKSLQVSDSSMGGYTAPAQLETTIIARVIEMDPMEEIATTIDTSNNSVEFVTDDADPTPVGVAEAGTRSETTGQTFGKVIIPTHECYAELIATRQLLEDNVMNLESYVTNKASRLIASKQGSWFISGNTVNQPEGIMSSTLVNYTAGGHASQLTDELGSKAIVTMIHAVKEAYAMNAYLLMNRTTLGVIRNMADGQGRPLWQPNYAAQMPPTILGERYKVSFSMPDIGANAYPILYGDINSAYVVVRRTGLGVIRDELTQKGFVVLYFWRRLGGKVVNSEAVRKLKIATS